MKSLLRDFLTSCAVVLRRPGYAITAVLAAALIALFALWLPSLRLLEFVASTDALGTVIKLRTAAALIGISLRSLPPFELGLIFATSLLFGLNVALASFYVRRTVKYERSMGASAAGLLLSIVGVGCAACGSVLLSAIIGASASLGLLGILPLKGGEFALLGILVLAAAVLNISRKIASPAVCQIPGKR